MGACAASAVLSDWECDSTEASEQLGSSLLCEDVVQVVEDEAVGERKQWLLFDTEMPAAVVTVKTLEMILSIRLTK